MIDKQLTPQVALSVQDVSVSYQGNQVLEAIQLDFLKGKRTAIVGPNGAGKSTLLKAFMGLLKVDSGQVNFEMFHTTNQDKKSFLKKIAYVPQVSSVDWDFPVTVFEVVMMGRYGHLGWFRRPKKVDKQVVRDTLRQVGMLEYQDKQILHLSGGQQQRVFLARALVQEAEIYILDEPLKGVDVTTESILTNILKKLAENGKTIIAVHHDLSTVATYFDCVALINKQVIANGTVSDTFTENNLKLTYGIPYGGDLFC